MHSGSITSRRVNCDITVLDIGGQSVLAYFRECTLEITADEIDVSAAMDAWTKREFCRKDWRVTCTALMYQSQKFGSLVLNGGECIVSTDLAGDTFYGIGVATGWTVTAGDPMTESITIVSAGGSPTLG